MKKELLLRIIIMGLLSILVFFILFLLKISHEYNYENIFPNALFEAFTTSIPFGLGLWFVVGGYELYEFYHKSKEG